MSKLTKASEIRNIIYRNVFVTGASSTQLEYILICKQVSVEARVLAYMASNFVIEYRENYIYKKPSLPEELKRLITTISIDAQLRSDLLAKLVQDGILPKKCVTACAPCKW